MDAKGIHGGPSGISSMVIGIVLRKDFIFMLWNGWVSRHLDAELLSSLYVLICLFLFQAMFYFANVFGQRILFSPQPRNCPRYNEHFEERMGTLLCVVVSQNLSPF